MYYSMPQTGIPQTDLAQAVQNKLDPFVVTLTPTAQDFSGVMSKTVAGINEAYEAGYQIVFRVATSATEYVDVDCTDRGYDGSAYPSFNASLVTNTPIDALVLIYTGTTSDGAQDTYNTRIYPLTPMS